MMGLPGAPTDGEDIEVQWEREGDVTKVEATLRDTTITVETSAGDAHTVPWLLGAMPQILEVTWTSIENAQEAK